MIVFACHAIGHTCQYSSSTLPTILQTEIELWENAQSTTPNQLTKEKLVSTMAVIRLTATMTYWKQMKRRMNTRWMKQIERKMTMK